MNNAGYLVRPEALDYLAGSTLDPSRLPPASTWQPVPSRRLAHVRGIRVTETDSDSADEPLPTEPLLAGLAGARIPFAFEVVGHADGVRFALGTWGAADVVGQRHEVLTSLVDGVYPSVDRSDAQSPDDLARFSQAGLVHGVPCHRGEVPWDRLLRSVRGSEFAVVVLAEPVPIARLAQLRDIALEDVRVAFAAQNARTDLPLTRVFGEKMDKLVDSLDRAITMGGWRTGVYLLGDNASYWRLAAAWQGIFADGDGDGSLPPPRVVAAPGAARLAAGWVLPDQPAPPGPRGWRHPFLHQTLLDTRQLASYAHFPEIDAPGFSIQPAQTFAVSRAAPKDESRSINIGAVLVQEHAAGTSYRIDVDQLTRHAFVAGLTGSGKTNTLMHLLTEVSAMDIPFLVIEPAKTEYRELLGRPGIGDTLRVFTPGRERIGPLRINPFEVPAGIDVSTHLDLLKAVFMASFAMWVPLPQILEQCLVDLYTERGWDFTTGQHRTTGEHRGAVPAVPTLGELVAAVERTVPRLGYKPESTQEITASLTTRLNALRRGSRGLMLDVERSISIDELLRVPTIVELEGLGDDADKAFVMGLLLIRLYEHRRAEYAAQLATAAAAGQPAPRGGTLTHLMVIEEAHRLLAKSEKASDSWHADPQGAFAETFSQMLSEVRAYGQGMIIADQVPVRLAPDVVKNTNLKIAHRLVAGDDRAAMAAAMSMDHEQSNVLPTLLLGRAAVFSEGDHTPVLVAIEKSKGLANAPAIDDAAVAKAMRQWRSVEENLPCAGVCRSTDDCRRTRELAESPAGMLLGGRLFTTAVADADGLDVVWPDVLAFVSSRTPNGTGLDAGVHAFALHATHAAVSRRAVQGGWGSAEVASLSTALRSVLAQRAASRETWLGSTRERQALLDAAAVVLRRTHDPYPLCASICADSTCRYRDPVADLFTHPKHAAFSADLAGQAEPAKYVLQVAGFAANDLVATSDAAPTGREALTTARWRALGCAAQVRFCATDHPREAAAVVESALASAGWTLHG